MEETALSHYNGRPLPENIDVTIYDPIRRDGEQMPGVSFSRRENMEISGILADVGVPQIEAGFPAVSSEEAATVRHISSMGLCLMEHELERVVAMVKEKGQNGTLIDDDDVLLDIVKTVRGD